MRMLLARFAFTRLFCFALLLLSMVAHAEPAGFRAFDLPGHGVLSMAVPRSWNEQMRQRGPDAPPTLLFSPERGYAFNVQMTLLWPTKPGTAMPDSEAIKHLVTQAAEDLKPRAAENEIALIELQNGWYFRVTDKAPAAGEFKYLAQGMLRAGDLVLAFTILSNDGAEAAVQDALLMLKSAKHSATASAPASP